MKIILPKIHFEFEHWKWNNDYNMYVSNLGNLKNAFGEVIEPKVGENGSAYSLTWTMVEQGIE